METPNRMLSGKERNAVRSTLRKALKEGRLYMRRTYYDYYDSCHAPVQTPDAPFELVSVDRETTSFLRMLKAGGDAISIMPNGMFTLWTGYSTYEVCTADQLTLLHKLVTSC